MQQVKQTSDKRLLVSRDEPSIAALIPLTLISPPDSNKRYERIQTLTVLYSQVDLWIHIEQFDLATPFFFIEK